MINSNDIKELIKSKDGQKKLPVNCIKFPHKLEGLVDYIVKHFRSDLSVFDLLELIKSDFYLRNILSKSHFNKLHLLVNYLDSDLVEFSSISTFNWPDKNYLYDFSINISLLSEIEYKLLTKFSKNIDIPLENLNLSHYIYRQSPKLLGKKILGQNYSDVFVELKDKLHKELIGYTRLSDEDKKLKSLECGLLIYKGFIEFSSSEIDHILNKKLDSFIDSLDARDRLIFTGRLGLDGIKKQTLQDLGNQMEIAITRERIRQLETKLFHKFSLSIGVSEKLIWNIFIENYDLLVSDVYPVLYKRFNCEKDFIDFISIFTGTDSSYISDLINPVIKSTDIARMVDQLSFPFIYSQVVAFLNANLGFDSQQSKRALNILVSKGVFILKNSKLYPTNLPKHKAIEIVARSFPSGAGFRELHKAANDLGICKTKFQLDRLDSGIGFAVDKGYVYQSDRGMYKHINFLDLELDDIDSYLKVIYEMLKKLSLRNVKSASLSVDIYENHHFDLGYYELRHIVREYGINHSIYFSGKSGTDTVSLEENFSLKGQKHAILDLFEHEPKARTTNDIAEVIRSGSVAHAGFYINQLIEEGKLVHVDLTSYDLPKHAFAKVNIDLILENVEVILQKANLPVEIGIIAKECNFNFHRNNHKLWYLSLLKYASLEAKINLYTYHNTISLFPVKTTVTGCVAEAILNGLDDHSVEQFVNKQILVDRDVLRISIHNFRNFNNDDLNVIKDYDQYTNKPKLISLAGWVY